MLGNSNDKLVFIISHSVFSMEKKNSIDLCLVHVTLHGA